jgi:UMF1 family MFS transporter
MVAPVSQELNNPKTVRAWYMYDWANSVYSLVITTAIFPIYYKAVTTGDNGSDQVTFLGYAFQNSNLYSYALSCSFLIVALILPLLSGAADYTGRKKDFMKVFVLLGSSSCMGLYFFEDISMLEWGIGCSILASIGYSGSLVFYDAFLPEIVTPDRYDSTSAKGYSMGYYGSVILMIACLILIMNHDAFGLMDKKGEALATRISFLLVGLWWMGFSLIPFYLLPNNAFNRKPTGNIWTNGYKEIHNVWESLKELPSLKRYLVAFFFYNMGVQSVMYLSTLFGTDVLHLETGDLIIVALIVQLVGALGAWTFSNLSARKGNKFSLLLMISIWIGVCFGAYVITNKYEFFVIAFVVGMVMGGIQSLSRATYSKLIPENTIDTTSYFSFYDVTYNLSIVFGTFSYGFINQMTGSMRYSALGLGVFFIIGMLALLTVKSPKISKASKI